MESERWIPEATAIRSWVTEWLEMVGKRRGVSVSYSLDLKRPGFSGGSNL